MQKAIYLIPYVTTGNGKVVLEYFLQEHDKDMRTWFCHRYGKNEVKSMVALMDRIRKHGMIYKPVCETYGRIIAPDGKSAYAFQKSLEQEVNA